MQQTVVRARTAADLLALVPSLVGMAPHRSLVLVVFHGSRTMGALRLDLPGPEVAGDLAGHAIGTVCRLDGADGVVPVVYADGPFPEALARARGLLDELRTAGRRAGLRVKDALCVAADGYGSLLDPDLPDAGRPLSELPEPTGLPPLLDLDAATDLEGVPEEDRRRFLARVRRSARATGRSGRTVDGVLSAPDPVGAIERALDLDRFDPVPVPLVAALADLPVLRDLLLLQIGWGPVFGGAVLARTLLPAEEPLGPEEAPGLAFCGGDMPRPDPERVVRAIELLRVTAAHLPERHRAPLLTMLAWLHWALGRGSVAGRFVEAARQIDPRYGLADLLARMLGAGMLPEWAYRAEPVGEVGRLWARRLGRPDSSEGTP
jgi:hypothetical protein